MSKRPYCEACIWLALSALLGIESVKLDLGTFSSPGPGFMPFTLALCLFLLSLFLFVQTNFLLKEKVIRRLDLRMSALYIFCYIIGYSLIFKKLGYLVSTFLFMAVLFRSLGTKKWMWTLGIALLATFLSYLFFGVFLGLSLPAGIF